MVSKIMSAKDAMKKYSLKFPDMKWVGNSVLLRNTDGRRVVVPSSQEVYMRGRGNFGIYEESRDARRKSSGFNRNVPGGRIGRGDHRHEHDFTRKNRKLY